MNLLDTQAQNQVLARIDAINQNAKPLWGTMTNTQMLAHVTAQIEICKKTIPAKDRSTFITRTIAKWLGLYLPIPLPKNLKTFKEIAPEMGVLTISEDLEKAKIALKNSIASIDNSRKYWHPIFGNLSANQMGKLTFVHLNHHLEQFGV